MKKRFYPKIALTGICKNKRLYIPYIFTCAGMVMMYYMIAFLASSELLGHMRGGGTMKSILGFGSWVIAVFAVIFLFYTNSFFIRRRKKEFGLYNILGMGKRNIAYIMFCEAAITAAVSLGSGLCAGIAFSKLAELGLANVLQEEAGYRLWVSPDAVFKTLLLFTGIFLLIFINGLRQIHTANPIALFHSENAGEKPPKANWFLGLAGVALLGVAYSIAVSIKDPVGALKWFFIAVIMVIVATYLLFIAGSVLLLRILGKKKKYYYKQNHFVPVAFMTYRMKRNGAGLASICILGTMILVMIASTSCLYFGGGDSLKARYPYDMSFEIYFKTTEDMETAAVEEIKGTIGKGILDYKEKPEDEVGYYRAAFCGLLEGNRLKMDEEDTYEAAKDMRVVYLISLPDYNRIMGTEEKLGKGEAMLYTKGCSYEYDAFYAGEETSFHIVKRLDRFLPDEKMGSGWIPALVFIVPDLTGAVQPLMNLADDAGHALTQLSWYYGCRLDCSEELQIEIYDSVYDTISAQCRTEENHFSGTSRAVKKKDYFAAYGGLFFLGIMLSLVFIFAAVLIIYYKQISEGYEDWSRFGIMKKVGMTGREIRKSINSQMLTVFFAPLLVAVIHLAFSFPLIRKLLVLFDVNNLKLLLLTVSVSVLVFAVFYALVYGITANAYYTIVNSAKEE